MTLRWTPVIFVVFGMLTFTTVAIAAPIDDSVRRVAARLQCPVCEGQSVADSNSGLAQDMRAVIRTRLEQGDPDQAIVESFVASYGEGILTDPPKSGAGLGVWIGPVTAIAVGAGALGMIARSWVRSKPASVPDPTPFDKQVSDELRQYREQFG